MPAARRLMLKSGLVSGLLLICVWASAAEKRPPIGTNLNGLSYWSTELPFLDSFKTAGEWVSGTKDEWSDGRKLDLDARGWVRSLEPGQVANMVLFHDTSKFGGTLARRYVVRYEGAGSIEYAELARLIEHQEGRDLIELESGEGNATLTITSTDPKDHLRSITVRPEAAGAAAGDPFNPVFVERLKGYRALRFMIWMLGEGPGEIAPRLWSKRPTRGDAIWTSRGAPVEIMAALANRVQADPWFTIPHAADDDYVRRFAQLVKKTLDPKRKVYLEYSNEVWNDAYPQTAYARKRGLALKLSQDPGEALLRFYAKRATEMFAIWEQVLGKERLVRVLAFQSDGDPAYSDEVALSFRDTRAHVDALAIGPYFGTELAADAKAAARTRQMSLDELFRELETVSLPAAKAQMLAHAAAARKYGLPMIAYEGGQHLWNMSGQESAELNALYRKANRDSRMGALYTRYLQDWAEAGGGLFNHLLDCANVPDAGNWGALEYLTQPRAEAPKFDALRRFMEDGRPATLKELAAARGIRIGSNYDYEFRGKTQDAIMAREFNAMTVGFFRDVIYPGGGKDLVFSETDEAVSSAASQGMEVLGQTLVWFEEIPAWVASSPVSRVEAAMYRHIDALVGRYAGRVKLWNVVNEAVDDAGRIRLNHKWAEAMGPDYIGKAFIRAHERDPNAILYYNDFAIESNAIKYAAVKTLLKTLLGKGVPLHALGWQMHVKPGSFDPATLLARFNEVADMGLDNYITELDVALPPEPTADDYEKQKQTYKTVVETFLAARRRKAIVVWGVRDGSPSWLTNGHALLFDERYGKKPAYFGVLEALR